MKGNGGGGGGTGTSSCSNPRRRKREHVRCVSMVRVVSAIHQSVSEYGIWLCAWLTHYAAGGTFPLNIAMDPHLWLTVAFTYGKYGERRKYMAK
jgi:hypothetical protein